MEVLNSYAIKEGLKDFHIEQDVKVKASDGTYQVDIYASFIAYNKLITESDSRY